jgi:hypothetical protein
VLGKTLIKDDPQAFAFSLLQTFPRNSTRQIHNAGFVNALLAFEGFFSFLLGGGGGTNSSLKFHWWLIPSVLQADTYTVDMSNLSIRSAKLKPNS